MEAKKISTHAQFLAIASPHDRVILVFQATVNCDMMITLEMSYEFGLKSN